MKGGVSGLAKVRNRNVIALLQVFCFCFSYPWSLVFTYLMHRVCTPVAGMRPTPWNDNNELNPVGQIGILRASAVWRTIQGREAMKWHLWCKPITTSRDKNDVSDLLNTGQGYHSLTTQTAFNLSMLAPWYSSDLFWTENNLQNGILIPLMLTNYSSLKQKSKQFRWITHLWGCLARQNLFMWDGFKTFHVGFGEDEGFLWGDWTQENTGEDGRHFVTIKTLKHYISLSWGDRDNLLVRKVRKKFILGHTLKGWMFIVHQY